MRNTRCAFADTGSAIRAIGAAGCHAMRRRRAQGNRPVRGRGAHRAHLMRLASGRLARPGY